MAYIEPHGSENAIKHKRRRTPGVTSEEVLLTIAKGSHHFYFIWFSNKYQQKWFSTHEKKSTFPNATPTFKTPLSLECISHLCKRTLRTFAQDETLASHSFFILNTPEPPLLPPCSRVLLRFLCLRTKGAGGIMFPGCPSVRIFVYAITQEANCRISSNLVKR